MKMYIGVREGVPDHMVPVVVAHAVLRHHTMHKQSYVLYDHWFHNSFKKCVVQISDRAWRHMKNMEGVVLSYENTVMDGDYCCATIVVTEEGVPNVFKFAPLWKPSKGE